MHGHCEYWDGERILAGVNPVAVICLVEVAYASPTPVLVNKRRQLRIVR
jgi:hypothetical protein